MGQLDDSPIGHLGKVVLARMLDSHGKLSEHASVVLKETRRVALYVCAKTQKAIQELRSQCFFILFAVGESPSLFEKIADVFRAGIDVTHIAAENKAIQ